MRVRAWADEPGLGGWVLDVERDGVRCYVHDGGEVDMRRIRRIPEPVSVGEMCRAVDYLVERLGAELASFSDGLREGSLDVGDCGVLGRRVRALLREGGFGWSPYAVHDRWLSVFLEAVTWWRRWAA